MVRRFNNNIDAALDLGSLRLSETDFQLTARDTVSGFTSLQNSNLSVSGVSLSGIDVLGGTLTFDSGATSESTFLQGGAVFDLNDGMLSGSTTVSGAVLNHNGGTISGNLSIGDDFNGNAAQLNRTAGIALNLDSISVSGTTAIDLNAGDSATFVDVFSGGTLQVNGATVGSTFVQDATLTLNSGSIDGLSLNDNSTFDWNGGTFSGDLSIDNDSTFNNNIDAALDLGSLRLSETDFQLTARDTVSGFTSLQNSNLSVSGVSLSGIDVLGGTLTFDSGATSESTFLQGGAVFDLNDGMLSGSTTVSGAVLNHNGGTISGNLSIGDDFNCNAAQLNRTAGIALNLDSISVSGTTAIDLNAGDSAAFADVFSGGTLQVNGATVGSTFVQDATLTLNSGSIDGLSLNDNSTFDWNGGTFSGDLSIDNDSTFNNNIDAALDLGSLRLSETDFQLTARDTVSGFTSLQNSNLSVSGVSLSGIDVSGGTLTFDSGATSENTFLEGGAVFDLNDGVLSDTTTVSGAVLNHNGGTISGNLSIGDDFNGNAAQLNRTAGIALNLDSIDVSGTTAIDLNAGDSATFVDVFSGGALQVNGATVGSTFVQDATLTLNSGSIDGLSLNDNSTFDWNGGAFSGDLSIDNGSAFNNNIDAALDLGSLSLSEADFQLTARDTVTSSIDLGIGAELALFSSLETDSFTIDEDGVLNIFQADGQLDGLLVNNFFVDGTDAQINIQFDTILGPVGELDAGLQVFGDVTSDLQALIDSGQLSFSGNQQDVNVLFDSGRNLTSVGFCFRRCS